MFRAGEELIKGLSVQLFQKLPVWRLGPSTQMLGFKVPKTMQNIVFGET